MYFTSDTALAARLATLDHCHSASRILLDSTDSLINLYVDTGSKTIDLARNSESSQVSKPFQALLPELLAGQLRIAGQAQENLVRLMEAQIHSVSSLAKFALDRAAHMSPPIVESAINTAESMMAVGENAADELCEASLKAVVAVEKKLGRSIAAKKKADA